MLFIVCVGIVVALIAIGWRQRWDPIPQDLPPVTLKSAREAAAVAPLPRWYWPLAVASIVAVPLGAILGGVLGRPWIVGLGLVLYGATWALRLGGAAWVRARTPVERAAAILRPAALLGGITVAALTRSPWWFVGGAAVSLAALLIAARDRSRRVRSIIEPPPRSG